MFESGSNRLLSSTAVVVCLGFGWRMACLALVPLPLLLIVGFAPRTFPSMAVEGTRTRVRDLLRRGWFGLALAAIFLGGATELGMAQWLPAYAETSLGFPAWIGGTSLLLFSVAMALGRMVVGAAGTRWNPYAIMALSCATSVVLFLAASFFPEHRVALVACILAGFTGSCLWPTMLAVTADRYPQGGASMFALLAAFGNAGGIAMPWLVGWVADHRDLHWGLATSALAPLGMLALVVLLRSGGRRAL